MAFDRSGSIFIEREIENRAKTATNIPAAADIRRRENPKTFWNDGW
jgi:hypothetical protein